LVANGDTQRRFYSGCPRSADGQNQIHARELGDEFRGHDRQFESEKVLCELGMPKFAKE
jgi:hypothetical protein